MDCKKIYLLLSPYQDNECDEKTTSEIFLHLQKCKRCQLEFELMERIKEGIININKIVPDTTFTASLMNNIKQKKKSRFFVLPSIIYSFIFIVFFVIGILINKDIEPKREEISISQLLLQGQNLNLLLIQEKTIDLLNNGGNHEG